MLPGVGDQALERSLVAPLPIMKSEPVMTADVFKGEGVKKKCFIILH